MIKSLYFKIKEYDYHLSAVYLSQNVWYYDIKNDTLNTWKRGVSSYELEKMLKKYNAKFVY